MYLHKNVCVEINIAEGKQPDSEDFTEHYLSYL